MRRIRNLLPALALALIAFAVHTSAQSGFDEEAVALIYHKLSNDPLDFRAAAEQMEAVQKASHFDKEDTLQSEIAKLRARLASADTGRDFTIKVEDYVTEYDRQSGEFSLTLFQPGHSARVNAFGQQYQLIFTNAESARAIAMAKDEARTFDSQFNQSSRRIVNEIGFRVTGQGDPAGGVTGARVIRAEMLSARVLDNNGRVLYMPKVSVSSSATAPAGPDIAHADVAGFHLGVKARDLEATLTRLFGPVVRTPGKPPAGGPGSCG